MAENLNDSEAGFTLVEVLVALALFSLLVTVVSASVRIGLKTWRNGAVHVERLEQSLTAQNILRRTIGDAYPLYVGEGSGKRPHIDFDGGKESVKFLGRAPVVARYGGRFRFDLFVDRQPDQADLVIAATPELADAQHQTLPTKTLLLADINRAEFSYFGAPAPGEPAQWQDRWAQQSDLPKLVRIRVMFRPEDTREWPDLLIAPRIAVDMSCTYDPITMRCRGR